MSSTRIRAIIAMLGAAFAIAAVAAPAQASSGVFGNGVCWYAHYHPGAYAGHNGSIEITLSCRPRVFGDYVATKYNVRFPGFSGSQATQFERYDYGGKSSFYANPGDMVYVQGCRERWFTSYCQYWSGLQVPWW